MSDILTFAIITDFKAPKEFDCWDNLFMGSLYGAWLEMMKKYHVFSLEIAKLHVIAYQSLNVLN